MTERDANQLAGGYDPTQPGLNRQQPPEGSGIQLPALFRFLSEWWATIAVLCNRDLMASLRKADEQPDSEARDANQLAADDLAWVVEIEQENRGGDVAARDIERLCRTVRELVALVGTLQQERDGYRIEADTGLRDYDHLELNVGILREALQEIADTRPNKAHDPWAKEKAESALRLFVESMSYRPAPSRVEAAEAALAEMEERYEISHRRVMDYAAELDRERAALAEALTLEAQTARQRDSFASALATAEKDRDDWHRIADDNLDRIRAADLERDDLRAALAEANAELENAGRNYLRLADEHVATHDALATTRQALAEVLNCKGPYEGTVSESGGEPAVCRKCAVTARRVLADTGGDTW